MEKLECEPESHGDKQEFYKQVLQHTFSVEFVFITLVINSDLGLFQSKEKQTQEKIRQFIENDYGRNGLNIDGLMALDFFECDDKKYKYLENVPKSTMDADSEKIMFSDKSYNMALECNSFNIENPKIPYPKNFSMDHGGSYVFCQGYVLDKPNEIIYSRYWGD